MSTWDDLPPLSMQRGDPAHLSPSQQEPNSPQWVDLPPLSLQRGVPMHLSPSQQWVDLPPLASPPPHDFPEDDELVIVPPHPTDDEDYSRLLDGLSEEQKNTLLYATVSPPEELWTHNLDNSYTSPTRELPRDKHPVSPPPTPEDELSNLDFRSEEQKNTLLRELTPEELDVQPWTCNLEDPAEQYVFIQEYPIDWTIVKTSLIAGGWKAYDIEEALTLCHDNPNDDDDKKNNDYLYEVSRGWSWFLQTSDLIAKDKTNELPFKTHQLCRFHPLSLSERFHHYNDRGVITEYDPAVSSCQLFTIRGIEFYLRMRRQTPKWELGRICMVPVENFAIFR